MSLRADCPYFLENLVFELSNKQKQPASNAVRPLFRAVDSQLSNPNNMACTLHNVSELFDAQKFILLYNLLHK